MREVILSKPLSMKLARMSDAAIRGALKRGRLVEGDAYIEGVVHQGITFDSLAAYCGWALKPATKSSLLTWSHRALVLF